MASLESRVKKLEDANGGGWTGHKPGVRTVRFEPLVNLRARQQRFDKYGFDVEPVAPEPEILSPGAPRVRKFHPLKSPADTHIAVLGKLKNLGKEARERLAENLGYRIVYPAALSATSR